MNKFFLSIIIPIYNLQDYIECCLKYILNNNNMDDVEIILVNDGSVDNSEKICKDYEKKYKNIKCIYQENKGVASARNTGLDVSSGEYIWFVDGDDIILPFSINILKEVVSSFNYPDVIIGKSLNFCFNEELNKLNIDSKNFNASFISKNVILKNDIFVPALWGNIFKSDLFRKNNIKINEKLKYTEDIDCTLKLLLNSNKIVYLNRIIYGYRKNRRGSATNKISLKRVLDNFHFIENWYKYVNENNLDENLKNDLLNFVKYEYAIVVGMFYLLPKKERNKYMNKIKSYKYLLRGNSTKKGKIINIFYRIVGFSVTGRLMSFWIKYKK